MPRARRKQRLCADLPEQPEAAGVETRLTGKRGNSIARDRGAPDSCPFLDSYGSPGVPAAHRVLPLIMMPNVPRESNPPAEKTVPTVQRAAPLFLPRYHRRFRFRSWAGAGASVSGISPPRTVEPCRVEAAGDCGLAPKPRTRRSRLRSEAKAGPQCGSEPGTETGSRGGAVGGYPLVGGTKPGGLGCGRTPVLLGD